MVEFAAFIAVIFMFYTDDRLKRISNNLENISRELKKMNENK